MDLSEIISLIKVRDYINQSLGNNTVDRPTLSELGNMLLLIDKKIINTLKGPQFKEYLDYSNIKKVLIDTRTITSGVFDEANKIKSGIIKR